MGARQGLSVLALSVSGLAAQAETYVCPVIDTGDTEGTGWQITAEAPDPLVSVGLYSGAPALGYALRPEETSAGALYEAAPEAPLWIECRYASGQTIIRAAEGAGYCLQTAPDRVACDD